MRVQDVEALEKMIAGGELDVAASRLDAALTTDPGDTMALLLTADLEIASERNDSARRLIDKALRSQLDSPRTAIKLLQVLGRLSESGLMIQICRQIPPAQWSSADSLTQIAHALTSAGAFDAALPFAVAATERDPKHPPALYSLATLKTFFGEHEEAAALCERCLALIPDDPSPLWLLSRLRHRGAGQRIDQLHRLLQAAQSSQDQTWLGYALHNELHEQGDAEGSWQALSIACSAMRAKTANLFTKQTEIFELLFGASAWPIPKGSDLRLSEEASIGPKPIFVVGLHRSGTTLAEQILAGHSKISSGGETYDFRAQLRRASKVHFGHELDPRVIAKRHELDYRAIGENYRRGMAWRAKGAPFVTEKLPSNYFNLGFIAAALPQSRIIHLNRDPIDVGFSSLRTLFSHAAPYSYDQLDFVQHHRRYTQLMDHWRARLPERILDVRYDDLVTNSEATARKMIEFVGLDFEPQMLALEKRTGAVATASSVMMRDGIRRDRGQVWKPYERHLGPLIDAFT